MAGGCIYCGAKSYSASEPYRALASEHVIPFSLGGVDIIAEASCQKCEAQTSRFERDLAQSLFGKLRIQLGIQTRRPKKRPDFLPLRVRHFDDREEEIPVSVIDHPLMCVLPSIDSPPFFLGGRKRDLAKIIAYFPAGYDRTNEISWSLARKLRVKEVIIEAKLVDIHFVLAKIAFCHAVAVYGIDKFEPFFSYKLSLGDSLGLENFIGLCADQQMSFFGWHELKIRVQAFRKRHNFLIVEVALFQPLQFSRYDVVVGRLHQSNRYPKFDSSSIDMQLSLPF